MRQHPLALGGLITPLVGDLDADGLDDIAVGVPSESVGTVVGAGAVNVVYAAPGALGIGRAGQVLT